MHGPLVVKILSCLLWLASFPAGSAQTLPQRVMSLNLCADQLLMALVPEPRIASITWLSRSEGDPAWVSAANRLPVNYGSAEEVLRLKPDLVLVGQFTTFQTRAILQRVGIPVLVVESVSDWEGIRRVTRQVALAVGEAAKGEQLLQQMDEQLAALKGRRSDKGLRVLGWDGDADSVPGRDTLFHHLVEAAGAINLGGSTTAQTSYDLEQVLQARPDVLLQGRSYSEHPSLSRQRPRHPVLRRALNPVVMTYPEAVFGCGVPRAAQLALQLAEQFASITPP